MFLAVAADVLDHVDRVPARAAGSMSSMAYGALCSTSARTVAQRLRSLALRKGRCAVPVGAALPVQVSPRAAQHVDRIDRQ